MDDNYDANPFASMLIVNHSEGPTNYQSHSEQESTYDPNFTMKQEEGDIEMKQEGHPMEYHEQSFQIKQEGDMEIKQEDIKIEYQEPGSQIFDDSSFATRDHEGYQSLPDTSDANTSQEQTPNHPRKKGRPKGAKNGTGVRSTLNLDGTLKSKAPKIPKVAVEGKGFQPERLPKMGLKLHNIRLSEEQIKELKKLECFFQPGVCLKIAPRLDMCKECYKRTRNHRTKHQNTEIECRFYQFRKLRYIEDKLEVAGFLDPQKDPIEVDRSIWLPTTERRVNLERRAFKLSAQNARLILIHVGEQLCKLIEKEKSYRERYKKPDKPIIWKRLINGVLENCDLCATTLFNFHFICTKCGLSLCVDCIGESKDGQFEIACSSKLLDSHSFEDMSLTQIIVDDSMEKIQKMFHDTCHLWQIEHQCELMKEKPDFDRATFNLVKNMMREIETGKSVMGRELPHKETQVEVDFSKIILDEAMEEKRTLDEDFADYFNKFRKSTYRPEHCKPIKHRTTHNQVNVLSISRSMSQATSQLYYSDVPHRWLCENKLLRLMDPLNPGNEAFFHEQWQRGQPVLISNVLNHWKQELWVPQSFSSEFGNERSDLINCMTGKLVRNREISKFWDGFENVEKRLLDNEGKPMLLKLKDWPPDSDFKNKMPSRFEDVMKNLPLNIYTNRTGDLNIVKYLPSSFLHPDLGPKGYFAYGSPYYLKEGTTNLHLDISDACNIMCFIGFPRDKNYSIDEYIDQGFKAILEADCDAANINRVIEDGEVPGAIWHIYEASDADRIRDFLLKIAQERGFQVAADHDVIHDQNWYLDGTLRARLFSEYNVKGYAIIQCLGDCIVLPAGTPHQVRNIYSCIKIAEDFVSPQQVGHCLNLSHQFRKLTKTHTNNEEKLNIKNVAYHSVKEAIAALTGLMNKRNSYINK